MTKGIREYVNNRFATALLGFIAGEMKGNEVRANVMDGAIQKFGISVASAATHYNFALKQTRAADPKSVEGLGRPEGKKGGRPVLNPVTVIKARTGEVVVDGVSRGKADELIAKAAGKKGVAKLAIKQDVEAAAAKAAEAVAPVAEAVTA